MSITYTYTRPVPGITPGTAWAIDLNAFATNVQGHNHTGSDETQIVPASININTPLAFNNNAATALAYASLQNQTPVAGVPYRIFTGTDGNLYYETSAGAQLQLTTATGIYNPSANAGSGFYGDYSSVTAKAIYTNSTATYSFTRAGGVFPALVTAQNFVSNVASPSTILRAFMTSAAAFDESGTYAGISGTMGANPVLGTTQMSYDSTNTQYRGFAFNPLYGTDTNSVYNFATRTTSAAATLAAHTAYFWTASGGTTAVGSGYQLTYNATSSISGASVQLGRLVPSFSDVTSLAEYGAMSLVATGHSSNTYLQLDSKHNSFYLGSGSFTPTNNTSFTDTNFWPAVTNTQNLGDTTKRWNIFANNISASTVSLTSSPTMPVPGQLYSNTQTLSWGQLNAGGGVVAGYNCIPFSHSSTGLYDIGLNGITNLSQCSIVCSLQATASGATAVSGSIYYWIQNSTTIRITTFNSSGVLADLPFSYYIVGQP